jgi:hypothetical protein
MVILTCTPCDQGKQGSMYTKDLDLFTDNRKTGYPSKEEPWSFLQMIGFHQTATGRVTPTQEIAV